jgi:hypothetical protein
MFKSTAVSRRILDWGLSTNGDNKVEEVEEEESEGWRDVLVCAKVGRHEKGLGHCV